MQKTKIEWVRQYNPTTGKMEAGLTWNPIRGCWGPQGSREKPNWCTWCYAKRFAERGMGEYGDWPPSERFTPRLIESHLYEPLLIEQPSMIFVCSMGEFFGPWVPAEWQFEILDVIKRCPQHIFILLTKSSSGFLRVKWELSPNVWIGVSICEEKERLTRLEDLAFLLPIFQMRFVSYEPLLGPMGSPMVPPWLDWVIIGALSLPGGKTRQPAKSWVMDILHEADRYEIPVFIKDNLDCEVMGIERRQEWPKDYLTPKS